MVNFYPWLGMVYYYNSKIRSAKFGFRFNQAAGSLLCLFYYWLFIQWNPLCSWKNWLFGFKVIYGKLSYCGTFHVIFLRNLVQVQCFCCGFNFWLWTCFWFRNKCLVSWNCSLEKEIYFVSPLAKKLMYRKWFSLFFTNKTTKVPFYFIYFQRRVVLVQTWVLPLVGSLITPSTWLNHNWILSKDL